MLKLFQPTIRFASLEKISVETLLEAGIRGLVMDLDNTLTLWRATVIEDKVVDWIAQVKAGGIQVCVVSNSKTKRRVAIIAERLGVPYVFRAIKPRRRGFLRAMQIMGSSVRDTAVIGDQLFTDVLGGNLLKLRTILVSPISDHEFMGTKILRIGERILWWMMKITSLPISKMPNYPGT
ncbi:MAG: YqeG family HAD IIIA-type phosphatase [Peptococcaceae bacterium]|jgi:HAD superfamily phosphatase (TIGR01668 family)|nr:YqeG family HAD IIIA-type phosphatase [Peptococcaceae bacterium]